jgi:hypothetical protein
MKLSSIVSKIRWQILFTAQGVEEAVNSEHRAMYAKVIREQVAFKAIRVTDTVLTRVDSACKVFNKAAIDFLVKYPGIAMSLSPQTVVRVAVSQHCREMFPDPVPEHAIDNGDNLVVKLTSQEN